MNEVEEELLNKNIINLKGYTSINSKKIKTYIHCDRLFLYPGLFRKIVNIIWNKIKYISFDKILVLDDISFIVSSGLVFEHSIIVEKYTRLKKDYEGTYLLFVGHITNLESFNKKVKDLNITYSLIMFDSTLKIESIKGKKEILFFPRKKQKKNCLVLNWKHFSDIVKTIEYYGSKIDIIKIYVNSIIDFNKTHIQKLCQLSRRYQFLIWEGTTFSSHMNVFFYQITGTYNYHKWVHMIELELTTDNLQNKNKILEALGSKLSINLQHEMDLKYYYKNDYFDKKFLDIFNE